MTSFLQALFPDTVPGRSGTQGFRGATATRSYAVRVRWMVGCLLSLVSLLMVALIILFSQFNSTPDNTVTTPGEPAAPQQSGKAILIARQRIEAGTRLDGSMFDAQLTNPAYVPEGAVLVAEKDSVVGYYAKQLINTGYPISRANLSPTELTQGDLLIPEGYRAIAIAIDEVSSVAYAIRPSSRVDVVLSYTHQGQPAVSTIVPTVKVLSIGGNPNPNGKMEGARSATLLVTPLDARKIELSKKLGTLSLVLASSTEAPADHSDPSPTLPRELIGETETTPKAEPAVDGKMVVTNPKTGQPEIYELKGGKWRRT